MSATIDNKKLKISSKLLTKAYRLMCTTERMNGLYLENNHILNKSNTTSSRGYEAIQIAAGFHQLMTEVSKSNYLSNGQFPVPLLIRVGIDAQVGSAPFLSDSVESTLLTINGLKIVYPSNANDLKGLMKASFFDPNPVILLEHLGLEESFMNETAETNTKAPDENYIIQLGKARTFLEADSEKIDRGLSILLITYGMGAYWAWEASKSFENQVTILDLRTLYPLDWETVTKEFEKHNKVLILTEESAANTFAESLAGKISGFCFESLDAPVKVISAKSHPAIALNRQLEAAMLSNSKIVVQGLNELLAH